MLDLPVHKGRRLKLISELEHKGIQNKAVLEAMKRVPRHWYFPKDFENLAYQAAVLAELGVQLYSIEYVKPLLQEAAKLLVPYRDKIKLIHGDGSKGYSKYAPYDAIIVTAGAPTIPQELMKQLKIGGRLVIPVGTERNSQEMFRITRNSETHFKREKFGDFKFVPLVGEDGWL
jgi:protein-L-isoaspartate(D-aspartate) O-methyltransferase